MWLARVTLDAVSAGLLQPVAEGQVAIATRCIVEHFFSKPTDGVYLDQPITLRPEIETLPNTAIRLGTLSILASCSLGNFGCSTTPSTAMAIQDELRHAANLLERSGSHSLLLDTSTAAFSEQFPHWITLAIYCSFSQQGSGETSVKPLEVRACE